MMAKSMSSMRGKSQLRDERVRKIATGAIMTNNLKLLCVLAHPDDESLGIGGILAKYAFEGVETYLVTATRGERGWLGSKEEYPGAEALGKIREAELFAAAAVLGLRRVEFLDYLDGELDQVLPIEAIAKITGCIRSVQPDVVVTFGPDGGYGHPDHIAICQFTTAALVAAADPTVPFCRELPAHRVSKFYYHVATHELASVYQSVFGRLVMSIDGIERGEVVWPDWAITTRIDTWDYWPLVWQAVRCHRTQLPVYEALDQVSEEQHRILWNSQTYYRAFSLINGGRKVEQDLFEGLRQVDRE
jgi:LmbE family N-acetylglucosaminyl deacetylase